MLFEHLFSKASASAFEFVIHLVDLYTNLFAFLEPSFVLIFAWKQHTGDDAVKTPFPFAMRSHEGPTMMILPWDVHAESNDLYESVPRRRPLQHATAWWLAASPILGTNSHFEIAKTLYKVVILPRSLVVQKQSSRRVLSHRCSC